MDIRSQVAARREQLEREARDTQKLAVEDAKTRRNEALEAIAADLSRQDVEVVREGDRLALTRPAAAPLDLDGLRLSEVKRLLDNEARRMWSPVENWQVIGPIVAGIFLAPWFWPIGAAIFACGIGRRRFLNERYRAEVRRKYPAMFASAQAAFLP